MRFCVRTGLLILAAGLVAAAAQAGSYKQVAYIPFNGATTDRGIAVNKNPGAYYGLFYGIDSASGAVRIWQPASGGSAATSYTDTGNKLSYAAAPNPSLLHHVFVGPDNTVWVADWNARQIATGPPDGSATGGNLTAQFQPTFKPRSIFVTGNLGQAGTKVYVAEIDGSNKKCEVWEYNGSAWSLAADLGTVGLTDPWFVTVDSGGNSYWLGRNSGATIPVAKIKPDYAADPSFAFAKPSFLGTGFTPGGVAWVNDPAASPSQYFLVSGYALTSCLRFSTTGEFLDGFGNTNSPTAPPVDKWTSIPFSGPGGNQIVWLSADDKSNAYVLVTYPALAPQVVKVHLQSAPPPPSDLQVSNDIYGQVKLAWSSPEPGMDDPSGFKVYRGTAPGAETLYATTDSYAKWKDAAQGTTAGGPFYYYVASYNGAGESAKIGPAGPAAPVASSAPAPGSKGIALNYSETTAADMTNVPGYASAFNAAALFLSDRSVAVDTLFDEQTPEIGPPEPHGGFIENDDLAGYRLLILVANRDTSSYTAQCIRDYVKYSQGKVFGSYFGSIADHKGTRLADFQLADVFRAHAVAVGTSPFISDATGNLYSYLKAVAGAPEAAALFAGLNGGSDPWPGAQTANSIAYAAAPFDDGTARSAGEWYNQDAATKSRPDAENSSLIVGYRTAAKTEVQSVFTGANWWGQSTANVAATGASGTFSADVLLENILEFLGVAVGPSSVQARVSDAKAAGLNGGAVVGSAVVTRVHTSGPDGVYYIQQPDGYDGIRVQGGPAVLEGQLVSLTGTIKSTNGEHWISVLEMMQAGTATIPNPVIVRSDAAGGASAGDNPEVGRGIGANNVGTLATITGKITEINWAPEIWMRIDDGAALQFPSALQTGIKVIAEIGSETEGNYVKATGVIGSETDGETEVPVLRLRPGEAVEILNP